MAHPPVEGPAGAGDSEAPAPSLTLQELRNTTELLEREALSAARISATDLDERRPIAPEPSAWLAYALWLSQMIGGRAAAPDARSVEATLGQAMVDAPVAVRLSSGEVVHVHPKSIPTICWLDALDADFRGWRAELEEIAETSVASEPTARQAAFLGALLTGLTFRIWAWVLTTPGLGLPFAETENNPEPPEWTKSLRKADALALAIANARVNHEDAEFLARAFPSERSGSSSRLPLSGFVGALAHEWGVPAREVLQKFSLRGLVGQAIAAAEQQRQSQAAAKAARE